MPRIGTSIGHGRSRNRVVISVPADLVVLIGDSNTRGAQNNRKPSVHGGS